MRAVPFEAVKESPGTGPFRAGSAPLWQKLAPTFSDCLFLALLGWLFVSGSGWQVLLADGDTGWHVRTGEYILEHGRVPVSDIFSFTRPGETWFAWEWLSDVIFAVLFRSSGLKGIVLLSGVLAATGLTIVYRHSLWRGTAGALALVLTLAAASASTIHFLARPHLFSFVLLPACLWLIDRDLKAPTRAVWLLVPVSALWTNLHGGFLALVAAAGLCAAGHACSGWGFGRSLSDRPVARRYGLLTLLVSAATFANPFGYHLHAHIGGYLRSGWIREAVEEFQSPQFRSESMLQFEFLLFAGVCSAAALARRGRWYPALLILFWAHASLGSVRHVPLYALAAVPLIASEATRLARAVSSGFARGTLAATFRDIGFELGIGGRGSSLWPAVAVAVLALASPAAWWPDDFPALKFPVRMIARHAARFAATPAPRVLTTDQWGDYLIYRFYPRQRVFIDGRSDFYGPVIGKQYVRLLNAQFEWRGLIERFGFDLALIPPSWPLSELLKNDPGWRLIGDDGQVLLFERLPRRVALNKTPYSAEGTGEGTDVHPSLPPDAGKTAPADGRPEALPRGDGGRKG
jgi:hypothetical protein